MFDVQQKMFDVQQQRNASSYVGSLTVNIL